MIKACFRNRVFLSCFILGLMLHIPVAFSMTMKHGVASINSIESTHSIESTLSVDDISKLDALYEDLELDHMGLSDEAYDLAVQGYLKLKESRNIRKDELLTIIDFSLPSSQKRLFILDVEAGKVLFNTYVAHGRGSGKLVAESFSNVPESFQSSVGFYETAGTYNGKNGFSMKLKGLEKGINHKAEERAIVVHGAPYVSEQFIRQQGYLGRSHGCPALPENLNRPIIDKIKEGSLLFIYSNRTNYVKKSKLIQSTLG